MNVLPVEDVKDEEFLKQTTENTIELLQFHF